MKTKIISIALAVVTMLSAVALFSGCSDGEYPVEVANITIESQPKNIVVLDAPTADILIATGYDRYIVGRSDEVDQQSIAVAPSVGSYENPDTDKIINSGTNLVFAGQSINEDAKKKLQDKGIQVVTMSHGDTPKQVETNYVTIGKICGGTKTGAKKGEDTYNELLDKMNNYKQQVNNRNSGILDTVCYLYTENDRLKMMTSGTYGDMLLGYAGAVNAAVNISDNNVDVATLKIANPNFIFYADKATLDKIKGDTTLASLGAVKTGKILEVSLEEMSSEAVEYIRGIPVVKTFGQSVFSFKRFRKAIPTSSQSLQQTQQRLRMRQRQRLTQQPQLRQQQPQAIQSRLPISIILPLHQTFHSSRKMKMTR